MGVCKLIGHQSNGPRALCVESQRAGGGQEDREGRARAGLAELSGEQSQSVGRGTGRGHHCGVMLWSLRVTPPPGCVREAWGRGPHGEVPSPRSPAGPPGSASPRWATPAAQCWPARPCSAASVTPRRPDLCGRPRRDQREVWWAPARGLSPLPLYASPLLPWCLPESQSPQAPGSRGGRGRAKEWPSQTPPGLRGIGTLPSGSMSQRPWFCTGRTWLAGLALEGNWADLRKAGNGEPKSPKCTRWHRPHAAVGTSVLAALLSGACPCPRVLPRRGRSLPRARACCSPRPRPD